MPRLSLAAALALACAPSALLAAPTEIAARVEAVTLFPWGAQVTRSLDVPAGTAGEVLVPNLPDGTDPASLRVAGEGVAVGAVTLMADRQPASDEVVSPVLAAARAEVERLAQALALREDELAALGAKATAAEAKADFLRRLDTSNVTPDQVAALAATVAEGVLAAAQESINAKAELRAADLALKPERAALERAQQALAALENPAKASDSLLLSVSGAGKVTITTFVSEAGWTPSYDLRLDSAAATLALDRFVSVRQASGEDWRGVALTLSTARPADRSDPSELWPDYRRIGPPEEMLPVPKSAGRMASESDFIAMAEPAAAPVAEAMTMEILGETVTYVYPSPVDIRDGVENLRLKLDRLDRPVTVLAEAVPMLDETAFRVVEGVNAGAEAILPGEAVLWLDGAVVGGTSLGLIAAGDKLRFGFGAIDGLRLKRVVPSANEGDRGIISRSNERSEVAEITVENLTGRDWPMRVIDRVPYADQEDLQISYAATPRESTADYDDKRGLLAWEFALAAGARQVIRLETTLRWPSGQVLR